MIGGGVSIGSDCFIGLGANIRNGVTIAPGVTVAMGAVVTRSLLEPGIYHGTPPQAPHPENPLAQILKADLPFLQSYNKSIQMKPIIIAEAGVNHNGSLKTALQMVDAAALAGADFVKFQTFKTDSLVTASVKTAEYQKANCNADTQRDMLRKLELPYSDFRILADHCREKGHRFSLHPFRQSSIDFLSTLGMKYMKVPSGEITNLPYLRNIASAQTP